jgi:CDP-diacylglycerol--glycerol-3-phosphate 3-phosphatidyltransferase
MMKTPQKDGQDMEIHFANIITVGRIAGTLSLLLLQPLSIPFYIVYALCGISDMLDGYVARKTNSCGKLGERLDSIADFLLITVMLAIFAPIISLEPWAWVWIGLIALVRLISFAIGAVRFRELAFLHTYANKATGLAFFCFPALIFFIGMNVTVVLLCGIASLSAMEELAITLLSKKLNRNIPGIAKLQTVMEIDNADFS